jgi:hypothetical protein
MEYMYAGPPDPETYFVNTGFPSVGYNKLINGIFTDSNGQPSNDAQIFNRDQDANVTQNTSNNSVVRINGSNFITLNPNLIVPYNDFSPELTDTANLPIVFPSNLNVVYDSVRYHILAGYNLDNIDGLILSIGYPDVDGSFVTFSQIKLSKGSSQSYTLNPSPLTIGSNIYDKYFEIKIPSLSDMINKYNAVSSVARPQTLAALTSKSGRGYLANFPIRVTAYSIISTSLVDGYENYGTQVLASLSLEPTDPFQTIGAYIAPADTGDFFEYFATENGGFIEDFILFQNSIGNSYYIQHSIEVLEQVGAAWLETSNFTSIQTSAYDVPNLFRPIVRYSNVATSFSLRYTVTLVNSKDQSRLIRIATYTDSDPGRYGLTITPLQLSVLPQQQKIFNKIAGPTNITVPQNQISPVVINKVFNVFVDRTLVNTSVTNLELNGTSLTEANTTSQVAISYGMGKAYIKISPFDNYYKFSFYKRGNDGTTQEIDLSSSGSYNIVFVDNLGNKVYAPSIADQNISKPAKGELAFKVDESLSNQILQFTNRKFYITNKPPEENPSAGSINPVSKISSIKERLAQKSISLKDTAKDIQIQAKRTSPVSKAVNTANVGGNSFSVLYWGNWLKEDELVPEQTPAISAQVSVVPVQPETKPVISKVGRSSWQSVKAPRGASAGTSGIPRPTQTITEMKISPVELKSAIASDVQGKIQLGWNTPEILSYFLDPSSAGYKLYSGITKEIFTQAVTGIFSRGDLLLLNYYGDTRGGRTNGGDGANMGSNANQSGSDSGSPNIPPIPRRTI